MTAPRVPTAPATAALHTADRLDSWKEIATYLGRDVTTAQRWEKREAMPVHRHLHDKLGTVYAFRAELDAWAGRRTPEVPGKADEPPALGSERPRRQAAGGRPGRNAALALALLGVAGAVALAVRWGERRAAEPANPLAEARFLQLTDFEGIEQAAAISRDGRLVAFQSNRDGPMDVWVTQVGTGLFHNLTRGTAAEIVNPSVRTLGFSPDGALVTFWARGQDPTRRQEISIWAVPVLGGPLRPYLEGAAELDWSGDGAQLVYHTPDPGDPMFLRDSRQPGGARRIFAAPAGLHAHFPTWSPDHAFVYFVQGALPDHLDLWRLVSAGGAPERITAHEAQVSHPVLLGDGMLLYLATDAEGLGPWIYGLDPQRPAPRRVSVGAGRYTSLAASADGRRMVATQAAARRTLWRVPVRDGRADMRVARQVPLTSGSPSAPRLGPGYLLYVASGGAGDSLWRLQGDVAAELWSAPEARITGGPAIAPDGRRIAFCVRQRGKASLRVANADGTGARAVAEGLAPQGAPAWMPDGEGLTVAAVAGGIPRLHRVFLDGRPPEPWLGEPAADPAWSPGGELFAFTGADVGTTFPVRVARADGSPHPLPPLSLTRGARRLVFLPGARELLVLQGAIGHKNVWRIDMGNGSARPVTDLGLDFELVDFDVAPDGSELVLEQVRQRSDVVLIERPGRD